MNLIGTLFYFIVALLLLVIVHEYGHFIVARWCGVKVLRFSFGFGKVLARWHDKSGTEYAWSLIPLGGYVKMLDSEEETVSEDERHLAFNHQPIWAKIAIVSAGPLFNFIFAFCALWLVLVIGIQSLAPMIEGILPGSIAERNGFKAHEEIIALNHKPIYSWRDFQYALLPLVGTNETVHVTVKSMVTGEQSSHPLPLEPWQFDGKNPDILSTLGIQPFVPKIPPVIGDVAVDSPAQSAGCQMNDEVIRVDGAAITDWMELLDYVRLHPGQRMSMIIKRKGKIERLSVQLGTKNENGHRIGFLGVHSKKIDWPSGWLRTHREVPVLAIKNAFRQTIEMTGASFAYIGRLAMGKLSFQGVSGPVGIAQGAGESARGGLVYYVFFLAVMSISLGVLNLLPIPLLDGGHLFYYAMEWILRRPLSAQVKSIGMYVGLMCLMTLMVVALKNDLDRLINSM